MWKVLQYFIRLFRVFRSLYSVCQYLFGQVIAESFIGLSTAIVCRDNENGYFTSSNIPLDVGDLVGECIVLRIVLVKSSAGEVVKT